MLPPDRWKLPVTEITFRPPFPVMVVLFSRLKVCVGVSFAALAARVAAAFSIAVKDSTNCENQPTLLALDNANLWLLIVRICEQATRTAKLSQGRPIRRRFSSKGISSV